MASRRCEHPWDYRMAWLERPAQRSRGGSALQVGRRSGSSAEASGPRRKRFSTRRRRALDVVPVRRAIARRERRDPYAPAFASRRLERSCCFITSGGGYGSRLKAETTPLTWLPVGRIRMRLFPVSHSGCPRRKPKSPARKNYFREPFQRWTAR